MVPGPDPGLELRGVPVLPLQVRSEELHQLQAVRHRGHQAEGGRRCDGRRESCRGAAAAARPSRTDLLHVPRAEPGQLSLGEYQHCGPCRFILVLAQRGRRGDAPQVQDRPCQALQGHREEHLGVLERAQAPVLRFCGLRCRWLHHARLQGHLPPVRLRSRLSGAAFVRREVHGQGTDQLAVPRRRGYLQGPHLVLLAGRLPCQGHPERCHQPEQRRPGCGPVQEPRVHEAHARRPLQGRRHRAHGSPGLHLHLRGCRRDLLG
mmetsp:Transcript_43949/g.113168  ORF Transcript_43949/g.113168 Transcript_43949/m.113168 type:complete len:263 (-) Transcript_43949:614-1402(-)